MVKELYIKGSLDLTKIFIDGNSSEIAMYKDFELTEEIFIGKSALRVISKKLRENILLEIRKFRDIKIELGNFESNYSEDFFTIDKYRELYFDYYNNLSLVERRELVFCIVFNDYYDYTFEEDYNIKILQSLTLVSCFLNKPNSFLLSQIKENVGRNSLKSALACSYLLDDNLGLREVYFNNLKDYLTPIDYRYEEMSLTDFPIITRYEDLFGILFGIILYEGEYSNSLVYSLELFGYGSSSNNFYHSIEYDFNPTIFQSMGAYNLWDYYGSIDLGRLCGVFSVYDLYKIYESEL